ncbi:hypothetical protein NVP1118B_07 [Vibrio phage 1.118.B._10N.261.49.F6]|nr:hypothetical protein NVP1118A_07 [Vibrio phage 1.118.A._10N.261.49.F6]AUR88863.1 hypothetical protein NVP1118B_07 [Vibrio phage 1.118.B._10N.261.49.F6]AUS01078.1 hypothetical protein NVP1283A_06 [Vibrio phage 1.283.A._10N.286.55.A1]AUS01163.1 hypothetical protein NVP1283B_06 [Vibrio phage 1.283.B._10N.286.55.A1]AUS01248.1 hypothetical protein NVP1283C_06 [Vibrio phage 1.283.C._10N.286.55.A1]
MSNTNEVREEMCREGKVISVDVEITNKEDALKLADTLFNDKSECGVRVHSWGLFSLKKATENRDAALNKEIRRHAERMEYLLNPNTLRDFSNHDD